MDRRWLSVTFFPCWGRAVDRILILSLTDHQCGRCVFRHQFRFLENVPPGMEKYVCLEFNSRAVRLLEVQLRMTTRLIYHIIERHVTHCSHVLYDFPNRYDWMAEVFDEDGKVKEKYIIRKFSRHPLLTQRLLLTWSICRPARHREDSRTQRSKSKWIALSLSRRVSRSLSSWHLSYGFQS